MHQTFYIDIDEEITSIVDRLRRSKSKEVVIVVPKRAILIQSIVNLKLLKKEATELKKEIIIVTQDRFGKLIIEKAGIAVEQRLDDVAGQEIQHADDEDDKKIKTSAVDIGSTNSEIMQKGKKRVHKLGSDGYYQAENLVNISNEDEYIKEDDTLNKSENENDEKITNKELVIDVGVDLKRQQASFKKNIAKRGSFAPMDMIRNMEISDGINTEEEEKYKKINSIVDKKKKGSKSFQQEDLHEVDVADNADEKPQTQKVSSFFNNQKKKTNKDSYKNITVESGIGKYFFGGVVVVMLVIASAAGYLFLPKTSITVFTKNRIQSVDTQIDGSASAMEVDLEKEIIPIKSVSVSDEITKTYDATGKETVMNQKSHGTITIYNEYSSSPQPLVATTRFETPDKKIFRLVVGITVPGTEKIGTEIKPGAIEAEVVADQSGEEYNIEATDFNIPGFRGSGNEKYAKIYAKSFSQIKGGGQGSKEDKVITNIDIEAAKAKIAQEAKASIIQKLKEAVGGEYILLDDAMNIEYANYTQSNSAGDMVDNFSITTKSSASAIVFKKSDIENVMAYIIAKRGEEGMSVPRSSVNVEFGKADADFENNSIIIRAHAAGEIVPDVDLDSFKDSIIGKKEDELKTYISAYPNIERVEIGYWPTFISGKISAYESRVEVVLDQSVNNALE